MLGVEEAAAGVAITAALAAIAWKGGALTPAAAAVAWAFGAVIVVGGGFPYLALLAFFVLASTLATRYRFDQKRQGGVQEGARGERGISNVVAHILLPAIVVSISAAAPAVLPASVLSFVYACAIAFATSDTFASELGVLSGHARSIVTGRPVPPGTNGGISGPGEAFAAGGAAATAAVALGLFLAFGTPIPSAALLLVGAAIAGFFACQVDSVLGELLENRGILTKGSTNFLGMAAAIALGVGILLAAGSLGW
ncbi:MAG: DUF92 domain-containing protein [Thermoplasmata archaeon]